MSDPSGEDAYQTPRGAVWRPAAASALVYTIVTAVIGRQVLASLGTAIAHDAGDPLLNAAILAWNATHVPWTDAWFQFPIFHPTPNALTFSEHLLGASVIASPIYWLTGNALTAYNLTLLLSFPLAGLAMYALVFRLTRHPWAALLAGLAFAFAPYRVAHLPQIQVQMVCWAPLALLGLHAFVMDGRRRWLALYATAWLLQGAANGYFLVYFSILVGLWILWFVVARKRWHALAWIAAATAVASVPLIPIVYRYLTVHRELGLSRNLGEIASFGADIAGLLCAPQQLTFWGWLHLGCGPEGELFAGATLIALCIVGAITSHRATKTRSESDPPWFRDSVARRAAWVLRVTSVAVAAIFVAVAVSAALVGPWSVELGPIRASVSTFDKPLSTALALLLIAFLLSPAFHRTLRSGSTTTFYLAAAVVCWILAWGPFPRFFGVDALYQAPFAWLLQLPGVDGLRVPARFWMMSVVCLSVFLGLVLAPLLARLSRKAAAGFVTVAACGLLADGWTTIPSAAAPGTVPDAGLRGTTVISLPLGDLYGDAGDAAAGYRAAIGGWRSINGYSGYEPGYYLALRELSRRADPALLEPFVERGDIHVLVREDAPSLRAMIERQPGLERIAHSGGVLRYRLRQRPPATTAAAPAQAIRPIAVSSSCDPAGVPLTTDGNLGTGWVCGAVPDDALAIDAGRLVTVGAIVLSFGPHGSGYPRQLIVETSASGREWEIAWEGTPAGAVLRAALDDPRATRVTLHFGPRDARYVRLRQVDQSMPFWSIAELELLTGAP